MKEQAIFVDGNNFYHGLRSVYKGNIDMLALARRLLGGDGDLHYYTALPDRESPHLGFLKALESQGWRVVKGRIKNGREKESDVALATDLVLAAAQGLKRAVVVSGDADLAPAIRAARELGTRVEVASFLFGLSNELLREADEVVLLDHIPWKELSYRRPAPAAEGEVA